ncbi:MAG: UDP-N-acetylglucosamine 2-epimerase (non-hydrolyzing) [Chitinophagales bacterium]|nr:UDP-N-acetylglucosamine 2-epimerase (non-hydrolyzing) [Chitinophagales bacterium]
MKIVTIIGARPQFVKAAAFSRIVKNDDDIHEVIVHTGQHFDPNMSKIFFDDLDIPEPQYHLDIHSLSHGAMTGRMMEAIEVILIEEKPDFVLVYGDTNSTLAGALAAKKLHIKVAHVEAGLRSYNMNMPEEINRILTDRISDILFCPTENAVHNLEKEGFKHFDTQIYNSGDIMYDAAMFFHKKAITTSKIMQDLKLDPNNFILATIHRQENTDDYARLQAIVSALNEIHKTIPVIVPLHPRTNKILTKQGISTTFKIIDPIGYVDMIGLISNAKLVMTDSGGLQKEAFFFGKYCITLRDQTEWVELVDHGFNTLVGANRKTILEALKANLDKDQSYDIPLYGDGSTALFIADKLKQFQ